MNGDMQIVTLRPDDDEYPDSVRKILHSQPLYAIGNLNLLGRKAIGICGSRNASERALEYAYEFGVEAAKQGIVIVSGYAKGVDRQAHMGVLRMGGDTIAVLPEGIQRFRLTREFWEITEETDISSNFLAVSMFERNAMWTSWRAMARNKLIVGLSAAMFVVEAQAKGGTMNAAEESLRQKKPLWAVDYAPDDVVRDGNRLLFQRGASPVKRIEGIARAIEDAVSASSRLEEQGFCSKEEYGKA